MKTLRLTGLALLALALSVWGQSPDNSAEPQHFEGPPSKSHRIDNSDWLDVGGGVFARISRPRPMSGSLRMRARSLVFDWSKASAPSGERVLQTFVLPVDVVTWGPVGEGLLAVATLDRETSLRRLELYRVTAPSSTDSSFTEPQHLRTLHVAAEGSGERILAVFANRAKPARAFVLLGRTSTLCSLDLGKSQQPLTAVLTAQQQPALAVKINVVTTAVARGAGPLYWFKEASAAGDWCDVGTVVELSLVDQDKDGLPDGVGFARGAQGELSKLLSDAGFEGRKKYIEFEGRTWEED